MVTPAARRQAAGFLQADFNVSERRACSVVELPRATCRYQSAMVEDPQLREDLRQLAGEWPRYGYRMLHGLLKRKGWTINHELVFRLYRGEGLTVRRRIRKRIAASRTAARQLLIADRTAADPFAFQHGRVGPWFKSGILRFSVRSAPEKVASIFPRKTPA
jgi:putative transposase